MTAGDLPKGFRAGAAAANFKKAGRDDLGLVVSEFPCAVAGLFTQNAFRAAPVQVCREILRKGKPVRAVLANAGQANACTGGQGLDNCRTTQRMVAEKTGLAPEEILPLSTGVIGRQLPMDRWAAAVPELVNSLGARDAEGFARAFMTTDAFPKFAARDLDLGSGQVRLTVMAKGAGMICPDMATMLCVALTDAAVERRLWQAMFRRAVNKTFNRVSVDGDTSTNDTILGLANGASGISVGAEADIVLFEEALGEILGDVAYMLVKDGEGASKVIHIRVKGARNDADAELAARSVGHSQLVKTAIYGGDANWGRIVTAVGYSGAAFKPVDVSLALCGIERFSRGQPVNDDREEDLARLLKAVDIHVDITLGDGPGAYMFLASDLGHEYVSLNAEYRS
ncbi:MAG: bifunctional glutamate N-acetyltransferase/amino-acid acetyltransferase ArgJ [Desulfovibrio sp.]|nr:bifunctional glutamate N-acetyltransferase/amino-acid acetyltransferase ArgJ [Desulfovibrio sp.]